MIKYLLFLLCFYCVCGNQIKLPDYRYTSEVADGREPYALSYPVEGYRTYSNPYYLNNNFQIYPEHFQYGHGRFGYHGAYPYVGSKFSGGIHHNRFNPSFHHPYAFNGRYLNNNFYDQGSKRLNDFEHVRENKAEQLYDGTEGFKDGNFNVNNIKSDSDHYNEEVAKKKASGDENSFHEKNNFNQQGNLGAHQNENFSSKKGHVVKGFKKHHHKDEDAKSEEFYDESHDEDGNSNFGEHLGSFGKNSANTLQGGRNNKNYEALEQNVGRHLKSGHHLDSNDGGYNHYLGNKQQNRINAYDFKNDANQHALLENQEISKVYKHHPYVVPFIRN